MMIKLKNILTNIYNYFYDGTSIHEVSGDCNCVESYSMSPAKLEETILYHTRKNKPITENVYRPNSDSFFSLLKEVRERFDGGTLTLSGIDRELYETTDIGKFGCFNEAVVPLDLPMEYVTETLSELEHRGKKVKLNKPMRGGSKKYYVYVKSKSGNVKKISFGDTTGLSAKVSNPEARRSFAARHQCDKKKDKTKAGYWACRINRYGHLFGGKVYPGYW